MRPASSNSWVVNALSQAPPCAYSGAGSSAPEKYGTSASYRAWSRSVWDSSGPSGADGVRSRPCQAAAAITVTTANSGPYGIRATSRNRAATKNSSGPRLSLGVSAHLRRPAEASRRSPRVTVISGWRTSVALSAAVRASSLLRAICVRAIWALSLLRMRGEGAGPLLTPVGACGRDGRRQNLMPPRRLARLSPPALMLGAMPVVDR